jgi:hypothetical protein
MISFFKRSSLEDIKLTNFDTSKRQNYKILCIDDQEFSKEDNLRRNNFNISTVNDIDNIEFVSAYDIVICDIQGVGKKLGSEFEGAHLISEIKKRFPLKKVIAYSGQTFNTTYNSYFQLADLTLNKDTDLEDWIDYLDDLIKSMVDPYEIWLSIRKYLIEKNIPTSTVSNIEQDFIAATLKKDINKLTNSRSFKQISPEIKGVMEGIIGSLLLKAIGV